MSDALNGVAIFAPDGTVISPIALPVRCANLGFGGVMRNRAFMAASQRFAENTTNCRPGRTFDNILARWVSPDNGWRGAS